MISISLPRSCMLSSNWNPEEEEEFWVPASSQSMSELAAASVRNSCDTSCCIVCPLTMRLCVCVCTTALGCHATMLDRTLRSRLMQALVHTGSRLQSDTREAQATSSLS